MTENIDTIITGKRFQSVEHALEIGKKATSTYDFKLCEQAGDFICREISLIKAMRIKFEEACKTAEEKDWDTYRNCMKSVYSLMPVTWVPNWEISSVNEACFILETLLHTKGVNIADKGSAANLLATKALNYAYENGSHENREAILEGANPQLYELVKYPLGITDDGKKVINLEDCAKALGISVDEYREMLTDSDFLPEGVRVNPIH